MSFKLGGANIAQIRIGMGIGSAPARRVMLGTGSTAVEVWTAAKGPARYSPTVYLPYGPSLATNKGSVSATPTVASGTVTQANLTSGTAAEDYVAQYAGRHTMPYSSGWVQGCCVSWWVRANVSQGNGGKDMWHRANASATTYEFYASVDAADGLLYAGCTINGARWQVKATSKNISDGNWHHCMVLLVRSSSTAAALYLYVDGASVGSGSKSGLTANGAWSSSQPFWIGGNRTSDSWQGQIDDFSVFDTVGSNVVNPGQLYSDGRQGIVPLTPKTPGDIGARNWLAFNTANPYLDGGTAPMEWKQASTSYPAPATSAGAVTNSNLYAYRAAGTDANPTTGFTIAYWLYWTNTNTTNKVGGKLSGAWSQATLIRNGANGAATWTIQAGTSTTTDLGGGTIPANTWTHVAATATPNGSKWDLATYINGTAAATTTKDLGAQQSNATIGDFAFPYEYALGKFDDIAIWDRALTPTEVASLAATKPTG